MLPAGKVSKDTSSSMTVTYGERSCNSAIVVAASLWPWFSMEKFSVAVSPGSSIPLPLPEISEMDIVPMLKDGAKALSVNLLTYDLSPLYTVMVKALLVLSGISLAMLNEKACCTV